MPKVKRESAHDNTPVLPEESDVPESPDKTASSDLKQEVSFHPSLPHPAHPMQQAFPSMFMPYIEDAKMDWTLSDGQYHQFLKWKLNVKTYLNVSLLHFQRNKSARK